MPPSATVRHTTNLNGACRMWLELRGVFDHLSTDPSTRAVVLSGAGPKAFTAGIDIQEMTQDGVLADRTSADVARRATQLRRQVLQFQDCLSSIERCDKRGPAFPLKIMFLHNVV